MNGCHQSVARLGSVARELQPLIRELAALDPHAATTRVLVQCDSTCRAVWALLLWLETDVGASPFSLLLLYRLFKYVYQYTVITYIPKPIASAVKVWFSGAAASAAHLNRGVAPGRESPPWSSPRYRPRLKPHSDDAPQNSWLVIIIISIIKIAYYAGGS